MNNIVTKATATVTPVDDNQAQTVEGQENGEFDVILSTSALDRDGDELLPDEWAQPLPEWITFDIDHGMTVSTTVGGGKPFINDSGQLQVRGIYSSIPRAQDVRTLVGERIIRNVSVAFANVKNAVTGKPERELLNGAFVAIPANTEAVVLSSKSANPEDAVAFADPGYRDDGLRRYPLNSPENVLHSALDFAMDDEYDDQQADDIREKIHAAAVALGVAKGLNHMSKSKPPRPYGDVTYADPENGKYPIDTAEHVRAAWDYINRRRNADEYSADELSKIKDRIIRAADKFGVHLDVGNHPDKSHKHFGIDAAYADPAGERYPLDTAENIVAAWRALNEPGFNEYSPAELELAKRRVCARACECGIELGVEANDYKSAKAAAKPSTAQSLHDVAVALGATCPIVLADADPGITDGANKSATTSSCVSRSAVPSAAAAKAAAADESADKSAQDALIAEAKALTRKLAKRAR